MVKIKPLTVVRPTQNIGQIKSYEDLVSTVAKSSVVSKTFRKRRKLKREKPKRRFCLLRCCCNVRVSTCCLLFGVVALSGIIAWLFAFISGIVSLTDSVKNIRSIQRDNMRLELQKLLLKPHHVLVAASQSLYGANITFSGSAQVERIGEVGYRNQMYRMLAPYVSTYAPNLKGLNIYYGLSDGYFGWIENKDVSKPDDHFLQYTICEDYQANCTLHKMDIRVSDYSQFQYELQSNATSVKSTFNPTVRPWYISTKTKRQPLITNPYVWSEPDPNSPLPPMGVTYTYPIFENNAVAGVMSFDYVLSDFSSFIKTIKVGKNGDGSLFVARRDGLVIASSVTDASYIKDGNTQQYHAAELDHSTQSTAGRIIRDNWGFDKVQDGQSYTFGEKILDVQLLPLTYNGVSLFESDWIVVIITPYFRDYFYLFTWMNVGSGLATVCMILFSALIGVLWFTICVALPLKKVGKKMEMIQDMKLDRIKIGKKSFLEEIRSIQASFSFTIDKLKEYRAFLPSYLLEDQEEVDFVDHRSKHTKSEAHTDISSKISAGSEVIDHGKRRSKFKNSLMSQTQCLVQVELLNFEDIYTQIRHQQKHFLKVYSDTIDTIKQYSGLGGGLLESFTQKQWMFSLSGDVAKSLATLELVKKQLNLKFKGMEESKRPRFGFGFIVADLVSGVIGSETIKKKIVFGESVDQCKELASLNKKWKTTRILCSRQVISTLKETNEEFVFRPIENGVYEIVETGDIKSDEWLYEMRDRELKKRFDPFKRGFSLFKQKLHVEAKEQFTKFLEGVPNDYPGEYYLNQCQETLQAET